MPDLIINKSDLRDANELISVITDLPIEAQQKISNWLDGFMAGISINDLTQTNGTQKGEN